MFISRNKLFSALKELNLAAMENRAAHLPVSSNEWDYLRESIQSSVVVGVFLENVLGDWWGRWKNQLRFDNKDNLFTGGVMFFVDSDETNRVTLQSLTANHAIVIPDAYLSDNTAEEHDYCFPYVMTVNISTKSIKYHAPTEAYLSEINKMMEREDAL